MFQSRFLFYTCKAENNLAIIHDKAGVRENCNICNELTAMLNLISIVLFSTDVHQGSYFLFLLEHTLGNLTNTSSSPPSSSSFFSLREARGTTERFPKQAKKDQC